MTDNAANRADNAGDSQPLYLQPATTQSLGATLATWQHAQAVPQDSQARHTWVATMALATHNYVRNQGETKVGKAI